MSAISPLLYFHVERWSHLVCSCVAAKSSARQQVGCLPFIYFIYQSGYPEIWPEIAGWCPHRFFLSFILTFCASYFKNPDLAGVCGNLFFVTLGLVLFVFHSRTCRSFFLSLFATQHCILASICFCRSSGE